MKLIYRPARIKDWQRKLTIIERLRDRGLSAEVACARVGCSRSTYWEWRARTEKLTRGRK